MTLPVVPSTQCPSSHHAPEQQMSPQTYAERWHSSWDSLESGHQAWPGPGGRAVRCLVATSWVASGRSGTRSVAATAYCRRRGHVSGRPARAEEEEPRCCGEAAMKQEVMRWGRGTRSRNRIKHHSRSASGHYFLTIPATAFWQWPPFQRVQDHGQYIQGRSRTRTVYKHAEGSLLASRATRGPDIYLLPDYRPKPRIARMSGSILIAPPKQIVAYSPSGNKFRTIRHK